MQTFTTQAIVLLVLALQSPLVTSTLTQSAAVAVPTKIDATITDVSIEPCPTTGSPAYSSADACYGALDKSWYAYCNSGEGDCICWSMSKHNACYEAWCPGYSTRRLSDPNPETQQVLLSLWESTSLSCAATPGSTPTTTAGGTVALTEQNFVPTSGVIDGSAGPTSTSKNSAGQNGRISVAVIAGGIIGFGVLTLSF